MSELSSEPRYPTGDEKASWTAMTAALDEYLAAFWRADLDGAASARERMLAVPVDWDAFLNTIRIPTDAGDWSAGLEAILRRIPDGWGRWIRVDRGWYPIIIGLDRKLAGLDPDYRVLQVKEKFGGLRYYWRRSESRMSNGTSADGNRLVDAAVAVAARTCESCGRSAALTERQGWLRTLCASCAVSLGYVGARP